MDPNEFFLSRETNQNSIDNMFNRSVTNMIIGKKKGTLISIVAKFTARWWVVTNVQVLNDCTPITELYF